MHEVNAELGAARLREVLRVRGCAAGVAVATVGAAGLAGWVFDLSVLKSVSADWVSMKANTAVGFILLGMAIALLGAYPHSRRAGAAARALAGVAAAIGLLTLGEYVTGWDLGIDELLFADELTPVETAFPGRMAIATALGFVCLGVAVQWVDARGGFPAAARALAIATALIAALALLEYLYGVRIVIGVTLHTRMAVHTTLAFLAGAAGLVMVRPPLRVLDLLSGASGAGFMLRRLLPAAVVIPVLLGWIRLWGQHQGWYGMEFGLALVVIGNVAFLGALIGWSALELHGREEERDRAEQRFAATFEQAAVGIAQESPDGRLLLVNAKLCAIVGYDRDELLSKSCAELTHPDDLADELERRHQLLAGTRDTITLEKRCFCKDQSTVWVSVTSSLVRTATGAPEYFISVVEDISRRKLVEETLRTAEVRLRSLYESNLAGVALMDPEGAILDANPAFMAIVGCNREDVRDGRLRLGEITPPEHRARDESALAQLREGKAVPPWEKELIRKDGSHVPVLTGVSRMSDATGSLVAFVLDLSERRRLEDQLRQAQRMEVIGRLAGGVAHDFNNLLTPVLAYSQMLLDRTPPEDPSRIDLEEILHSAERGAALTRQLLAFSRKQVLQPRVLDLNPLIQETTNLLKSLIGEDIELRLFLTPDLHRVNVDPGQIEQVLMNLATNARDAMPRGGTLTIETSNVVLDAAYASSHPEVARGDYVLVAVSDTGTGIDRHSLARLFEPFFTTKEVGRGTGLGLATVYGIVKQSRGHIATYSEVGRGSTFKIYLPRTTAEADSAVEEAPAPTVVRGIETLLVAEDDDALRVLIAKVLGDLGYTVLQATSGESALMLAKQHLGTIDLLITDVIMPGMSGRELTQQVKVTRPALRVLYISGYTENAIVHHGVLDEGTELLEKPFTPTSLARRVRSILDRPWGSAPERSA
jgi:PAS domain S-box-containing protein